MGTVNLTDGNSGVPHRGLDKVYVVSKQIDFSANNASSADVIQCINIEADTLVLNAGIKIVTPEGGTATGDLGFTGDDPNGFTDATNLNAAAGTIDKGVGGTDQYVTDGGKLLTAADTLDLVLDNDMDTAVIVVFAICVRLADI